jgi:23S rRNA (adenine2030-N6)-methyltransferase
VLSYQHDYHAGNHADVLKHSVFAILIRLLQQKPAPIRVLDSHAGSGVYDLDGALAQHGREFDTGIARAFAAQAPPPPLAAYLDAVAKLNPTGNLRFYPGSPQLALMLLRAQDQLELFELHPQAAAALRTRFRRDRQVHVHCRDGFEGLLGVLPPREHRGIVLIDPSYEQKNEYARVVELLDAAHKRWANGVFVVWYPLIRHAGSTRLIAAAEKLNLPRAFRIEIETSRDADGLRGSGLLIVNLPYRTDRMLGEVLPWLVRCLGRESAGGSRADWLQRN